MLLSIATYKDNIHNIDFAGGDPLHDTHCIEIINYAHTIFSKNQIFISSTGESILCLKDKNSDFFEKTKNFELTYDYPNAQSDERRKDDYNYKNFESIKWLVEKGCNVYINFMLGVELTDVGIFDKLLKEIDSLDVKSVTMIRPQPVGKLKKSDYENYNPIECINKFIANEKYKSSVFKLHCSFRTVCAGIHCNMLEEKIGIDAEGNVFACPWASNLEYKEPSENPLYIGNLLESNLDVLMTKRNTRKIRDKYCGKNYCYLTKIWNNQNNLPDTYDEKSDPLYSILITQKSMAIEKGEFVC
jgi:hypothetical protein